MGLQRLGLPLLVSAAADFAEMSDMSSNLLASGDPRGILCGDSYSGVSRDCVDLGRSACLSAYLDGIAYSRQS